MKDTIKNTVNEVYNTNEAKFKKNVHNFDGKLNALDHNKNGNFNRIMNTNTNSRDNMVSDSTKTVSKLMIILPSILVFIVVGGLLTLLYMFRDNISVFFKDLFHDEEMETKMQELEKQVENEKEQNKALEEEVSVVKKEKENKKKELKEKEAKKMDEKKKETKETKEKETKKPRIVNNDSLKQNYKPSSIINEDSFCYIGTDDNMRHCVPAYAGDICTSGDIYKRMDDCLIPKLPALDSCVPSLK